MYDDQADDEEEAREGRARFLALCRALREEVGTSEELIQEDAARMLRRRARAFAP